MTNQRFATCALLAAALALPGCYVGLPGAADASSTGALPPASSIGDGEDDSEGESSTGAPQEWEPGPDAEECRVDTLLQPAAYGTKVKTLLTGLPLTDVELDALEGGADALPELVDSWLALPQARPVLERFFLSAFQSGSGNSESLFHLLGVNARGLPPFRDPDSARSDALLNKNFADSFAKTALNIALDGRPFFEVITTDTYMMTTAMMMFLAFTDDFAPRDDNGYYGNHWLTTDNHFPTIRLLRTPPQPPLEEVLDPTHPNWMTFYTDKIDEFIPDSCGAGSVITVNTTAEVDGEWTIGSGARIPFYVFNALLLGRVENVRRHNADCSSGGAGSMNGPIIAREDFADWRPVRITQPTAGEDATYFYEVFALRDAQELRLHTERAGFLTHPGFLSTWLTNEDNSMRVIINQALIVALGASFDGETVTDFTSDAINKEHADPGSECYGCHQQLDPMREFYRASFTNHYGQQLDPERSELPAQFVFGDIEASGSGVGDLAKILADHPYFPYAWAQKLCWYANAEACPEGEELERVTTAFVDSGHDFRVLVRELFSSPLVTGHACVGGVEGGARTAIARQSTFCNALSVRLGIDRACATSMHLEDASALQRDVARAAASIPDDAFSRSVVEPIVIAETGLFTRANREAACDIVGQDGFALAFEGADEDAVLDQLVTGVMALPHNDERHAPAREILEDHVDAAIAEGSSPELALQSALAVACMSPGAAGIGF